MNYKKGCNLIVFGALVLLMSVCCQTANAQQATPLAVLLKEQVESRGLYVNRSQNQLGEQQVYSTFEATSIGNQGHMTYRLDGSFQALHGYCGYESQVPEGKSCTFQIFADGEKVYDSAQVLSRGPAKVIEVWIGGAKELRLSVQGPSSRDILGAAFGDIMLINGAKKKDYDKRWLIIMEGQEFWWTFDKPGLLDLPVVLDLTEEKQQKHHYSFDVDHEAKVIKVHSFRSGDPEEEMPKRPSKSTLEENVEEKNEP